MKKIITNRYKDISQVYGAFLFCIITLFSCMCKVNHLSKDDLRWGNCYRENDTLIFSSNDDMDTLIINKILLDNPESISAFDLKKCNWIEIGTTYFSSLSVEGVLLHKYKKHCFVFTEQAGDSYRPDTLIFSIQIGENFATDVYKNVAIISKSSCPDKIVIWEDQDIEMLSDKCLLLKISNIKWGKGVGLISYTTVDGNEFVLNQKK